MFSVAVQFNVIFFSKMLRIRNEKYLENPVRNEDIELAVSGHVTVYSTQIVWKLAIESGVAGISEQIDLKNYIFSCMKYANART